MLQSILWQGIQEVLKSLGALRDYGFGGFLFALRLPPFLSYCCLNWVGA